MLLNRALHCFFLWPVFGFWFCLVFLMIRLVGHSHVLLNKEAVIMDVIPEVIVPSPKENKKKQEEKESIRYICI